jgi:hypothetical protein
MSKVKQRRLKFIMRHRLRKAIRLMINSTASQLYIVPDNTLYIPESTMTTIKVHQRYKLSDVL